MVTPAQRRFLNELSEEAGEVYGSKRSLWLNNLSRYFDVLDSDATARGVVNSLEGNVDFDAWHKAQEEAMDGETGELRFPRDRRESLGIRLRLFRAILNEKFDTFNFGLNFLGYTNEDDIVWAVSQAIFSPMARDLSKYLTEYFDSFDKVVPASDRIVRLDNNSAVYKDTNEAAKKFQEELIKTNIDLQDKEQLVAEVSAGIELLKAPSVNAGALRATLVKVAKYVADKAAGATIGVLAGGLMGLIARLFGIV